MSGVAKAVKKVFKTVVKVVKKIAKPILIGAAVYFTAGMALSAFTATQAFAASLPGFGISSTGAATGIFSKAASTLGLAGGLQAGAGVTAASAAAATGAAAAGTAGAGAGGGMTATLAAGGGAATTAAATGSGLGAGVTAATGMSLTNKLLLASVGAQAVGAFLAPDIDDVAMAQKKWRGAYYGMEAGGAPTPTPTAAMPQQATNPNQQPTASAKPVGAAPSIASPAPKSAPRELMTMAPNRQTTEPVTEAAVPTSSPRQLIENQPIVPKRLMAEDVRYVS